MKTAEQGAPRISPSTEAIIKQTKLTELTLTLESNLKTYNNQESA